MWFLYAICDESETSNLDFPLSELFVSEASLQKGDSTVAIRDILKAITHITVTVLVVGLNLTCGVNIEGGVQYLRYYMKSSEYESFVLFSFFLYYDWDDRCVKPHK